MSTSTQRIRGRFWLPDHSDDVIVGDLVLSPGSSAKIDLSDALPGSGVFSHPRGDGLFPVVHGWLEHKLGGFRTANTTEVTLIDCHASGFSFKIGTFSNESQVLSARRVLVGPHTPPSPAANAVRVSFDRLAEWLFDPGLDYSSMDEIPDERTMRWRKPTEIVATLASGPHLCIRTHGPNPSVRVAPDVSLETWTSVELDTADPLTLDDWHDDIGRLQHFLAFVTGQRAHLTYLALRVPINDDLREPLIDVAAVQGTDVTDWRPDRHLLHRKMILGGEAELLRAWWDLSERTGIVLDSVVDAACRTTTYDPGLFLRLAAGAEAYHTLTTKDGRDAEVRRAASAVSAALPAILGDDAVRKRLEDHLRGLKSAASYADRLNALVNRLGPANRALIDWNATVTRDVKNLRNFLAHGMSHRKPIVLDSSVNFVRLIQRLQAVLRGNILLDLGLSIEDMTAVLEAAYGPSGWYRLIG